MHISFSRFSEGNYRSFFCPSRNTKFSAERNVAECEFLGYISRDVQTDQTCLSPKRTFLCHQTGNSHLHNPCHLLNRLDNLVNKGSVALRRASTS